MNAAEALLLCRYAKAASPSQYMDEYTPDTWFDLLEDLRYVDAQEAIRAHLRKHPYVAPCDIREGVYAIREKRRSDHPHIEPPRELRESWRKAAEESGSDFDEFRLEQQWSREINKRIGDGEDLSEFASGRAIARKPEGW